MNYYDAELTKLGIQKAEILLSSMDGETTWMNLNNDSAEALTRFLLKRFPEVVKREVSIS